MNYEHTQNLANDLSNLLKDDSNSDVKIRVGKEQNIKEFKAHSIILSSRSIYFQKAFSEQWAKKEDGFFISSQPNISPKVFEILKNYIYLGKISVDNNEISLVDILIASDELGLLELYQQLEKRLLENESAWKLPKDFITLCQHDRLSSLYQVAVGLYLIEWGIKNTASLLNDDLTEWTPTYFTELEKTLHNCIPYIRFSQMSFRVFNELRKQYKNILPEDLVEDVIQYFSDPNSKPLLKNLPLRISVYPFDSKIINAKDAATIASWIGKKEGIPYRLKDIPFKFKLIYRASREGFNANKFHECCDNKGPTVVIIKVRNSGEIIGGYNPLDWRSIKMTKDKKSKRVISRPYIDHKRKTSNSFIFSLLSSTNGVIPKLSRVTSKKEAIIWCENKGPCFGLHDLWIPSSYSQSRSGTNTQKSYEKKVIDRETFDIEDYEVFQIIDKSYSPLNIIKRTFNFSVRMYKKMEKMDKKKMGMRSKEGFIFS
ncbi:BTB/POZ domain-containing protein [Rhizophagus clarus]|uniref:BTB/POZ domain-containing protein n=2 Tax=Rhizophagus clarus TaxID=94130 RepID=A0A8H3LSB1_9GLOM|nr:BTB/POZ domain-containing protein [Rhizophagus clarus]